MCKLQSVAQSERVSISATFITSKCSNGVLQLERGVRPLYFIGTSVRSGLTSGARARAGSSRPWERSAFNVSHVLRRYYQRRAPERDGARDLAEPDKDSLDKRKTSYDNKTTATNINLWAFAFKSLGRADRERDVRKNKTVMELLIYIDVPELVATGLKLCVVSQRTARASRGIITM